MVFRCKLFDSCAEADQELHIIKLNRTSIGDAPLVFFTIITLEMIICSLSILLLPLLCSSVLRAAVIHRNFRCQLCLASSYIVFGVFSRLSMLTYQLLDWPISVNNSFVFTCDLLRDMVMGYFCSIFGSFAIERTIATRFWKWYERACPSTLLVLIGAELTFIIPLGIGGTLTLFGIVTTTSNIIVYAVMFTISTSVFLHTYLANVAILARMECGAEVGEYFVAKRFQVRENVLVMKYMFRTAKCAACLIVPAFGCFAFKIYGPVEWLLPRNIAYAFFDLLIASIGFIFMVNVILGNETVWREFKNHSIVRTCIAPSSRRRIHSLDELSDRERHNEATEIHFSQLADWWN